MGCEKCDAKCCKHIALEIDKPESKEDFEDIRWYVAHKNVNIFVEDGDWYIEFLTPCEHLNKDNKCEVYETRPKICKDYSEEECVFGDYKEELIFHSLEELDSYIKEKFEKE
jgi:Fe-S-cluster containining protein